MYQWSSGEYLNKEVMALVTQGLAELCRTRPQQPVRALADFIDAHLQATQGEEAQAMSAHASSAEIAKNEEPVDTPPPVESAPVEAAA